MKGKLITILTVLVTALLMLSASSVAAQLGEPPQEDGPVSIDAVVNSRFSYQGVLKEGGNPVNGTRDMTFGLYSDNTCTTQVGDDIIKTGVQVSNGLFSVALDVDKNDFNGQGLWLKAAVGATSVGCQEIMPVPYALSLRPGAVIAGSNTNALAPALVVRSMGGDLDTAITALVSSEDGYAGYFWNLNGNGTAVYAAGKIQSSTTSSQWISGNHLVKYNNSDSTVINFNGGYGSATITRGATAGTKYVVLPISVAGPLFGQDVTVSGLDLYWRGDTEFSAIANIRLRRQTGTCPSCYVEVAFDNNGGTGYTCEDAVHAQGCTIHVNVTSNNVLTDDSGILYLAIGLDFAGSGDYIDVGGVRLTLEHD